MLDAAIRGPSSGNSQRWGWIVVTDERTKQQIGEWYEEAWDDLSRGKRDRLRRIAAQVAQRDRRRRTTHDDPNLAAGNHLARAIGRAPVWVIPVLQGVRGEPGLVEGADIFGAIQNLLLAARKLGIGGTITMLHRRHERDVRRLLGLPDDACTIALIPLGYPDGVSFTTPRRKPVETVTHWNHWGEFRPRGHREPDRPIDVLTPSGAVHQVGMWTSNGPDEP